MEKVDIFCNYAKIQEITKPIFVIHGQKDELIQIADCKNMVKKGINIKTWYPEDGTHGNILTKYRYKFYQKVKAFIFQISQLEYDKNIEINNNGDTVQDNFDGVENKNLEQREIEYSDIREKKYFNQKAISINTINMKEIDSRFNNFK